MTRHGLVGSFVMSLVALGSCGGPGGADDPNPVDPYECAVRNDDDLCPHVCPIPGRVVVLLDPSDTVASVPIRDARNKLGQELAELDPLTELRIYTVGDAGRGEAIRPRFQMCVPVDPEGGHNPDLFHQNYDRYHQGLDTVFATVFREPADTISPIVEAVQAVKVDVEGAGSHGFLRVVFVSDMVQHSPELSFFRQKLDYDEDMPAYLGADLSGFSATVYVLLRRGFPGEIQSRDDFRRFWDDYSRAMKAQSWEWREVTGVSGSSQD